MLGGQYSNTTIKLVNHQAFLKGRSLHQLNYSRVRVRCVMIVSLRLLLLVTVGLSIILVVITFFFVVNVSQLGRKERIN